MSTAVAERPQPTTAPAERVINYVPLGAKQPVELTINMVRRYLCTATRQGHKPTDDDVIKFMMLCKARELDPWVGDAFLTGYDTQDGPQFSLITAVQALYKRAEISPEYDGIESGVVVRLADGTTQDREGDFYSEDETLVGGWARCHRKDRKIPAFDRVKFSTFNTDKSRWKKDPGGMIAKVAEASVLRKSFPTQLGGLYTRDEMEHLSQGRIEARDAGQIAPVRTASNLDELAARMEEKPVLKELAKEADKLAATVVAEPNQPGQQSEAVLRYEAMAAECDAQGQIDQLRAAAKKDEALTKEDRAEVDVYLAMAEKRIGKK